MSRPARYDCEQTALSEGNEFGQLEARRTIRAMARQQTILYQSVAVLPSKVGHLANTVDRTGYPCSERAGTAILAVIRVVATREFQPRGLQVRETPRHESQRSRFNVTRPRGT